MSSWVALNVKYADPDDEWTVPDLKLSKIDAHKHPFDDHGFDLLLDTFVSHIDSDFAIGEMVDIAVWNGKPSIMLAVVGDDTSDMFSYRLLDLNGETIKSWSEQSGSSWSKDDEVVSTTSQIEKEIGVYPSRGGNYRDYE